MLALVVESRIIKNHIKIVEAHSLSVAVESHRKSEIFRLSLGAFRFAAVARSKRSVCGGQVVVGAAPLNQRITGMIVGGEILNAEVRAEPRFGCAFCTASEHGLCDASRQIRSNAGDGEGTFIPQVGHTIKSRRLIVQEQDFHDAVPIICSGWAAIVTLLADGRRQILSILLPGDIVSTGLLFAPKPGRVVEAITDLHYRTFKRRELKNLLFRRTEFLDNLLNAWISEQTRADRLIVDLGRRSGEERIARLILELAQRLKVRNMMRDPVRMDFPLRQHHIADATGLTQVHVSKVVSDFRRSGLVDFHQRSLTILDLEGLRRRANVRVCRDDVFYALPAM